MTLTASHRRKRSIALSMLLVWAFALLSGVANACLTEREPEHAGPLALQANQPAQAPLHQEAVDQAQRDDHTDKVPCRHACEESSQTLLKQLPKFDTPQPQTAALPTPSQAIDLYTAPAALVRTALAAVPPPSPPLRVQFSRLTL